MMTVWIISGLLLTAAGTTYMRKVAREQEMMQFELNGAKRKQADY